MDAIRDIHNFVSRVVRVAVENKASTPDTVMVAELLCAVADGDIFLIDDVAERIRNRALCEPFERVPLGCAPLNILHYAAVAQTPKSLERVLYLERDIERLVPIDANAVSGCTGASAGATPLHIAATLGHLAQCKILLTAGANARAVRGRGITVLHDALQALERSLPPVYFMYAMRPREEQTSAAEKKEKVATSSGGTTKQTVKSTLKPQKEAEPSLDATRNSSSVTFSPGDTTVMLREATDGTGTKPRGPFGLGAARIKLQALVQQVKASNVMTATVHSVSGESEASTSYAPTPARNALAALKGTENPNEARRIKLLAGLNTFQLCVLLAGSGSDVGISSVPGCAVTKEGAILLADMSREVTRRMQNREGVGLEAVAQDHKLDAERKLRPEESSRPSHQLFIRDVLAYRCQQDHQRRVADVLSHTKCIGSVGDHGSHGAKNSPRGGEAARQLGDVKAEVRIGDVVIISPFSEYVPPRLTQKWVDKRLRVLQKREDEIAEGNVPSPLRLPHSPTFSSVPLRPVPSIARLQLLAPPSFVKKAALRPPNAMQKLGEATVHDAFGSMTVSRSGFDRSMSRSNRVGGVGGFFDVPLVGESGDASVGSPTRGGAKGRRGRGGEQQSVVKFASFRSVASTQSQSSSGSKGQSPKMAERRSLAPLGASNAEPIGSPTVNAKGGTSTSNATAPKTSAAFRESKGVALASTLCGEVLFVGTLRSFKWKPNWHEEHEKQQQQQQQHSAASELPPIRTAPAQIHDTSSAALNRSNGPPDAASPTRRPTGADPQFVDNGSVTFASVLEHAEGSATRQHRKSLSSSEIEDEHLGPEEVFVGLAVPRPIANCDGRYLGDGARYFDTPDGLGGLFVPLVDVVPITSASEVLIVKHRLRRAAQEALKNAPRDASPFSSAHTASAGALSSNGRLKGEPPSHQSGGAADWALIARRSHNEMHQWIAKKKAEELRREDAIRTQNVRYVLRDDR